MWQERSARRVPWINQLDAAIREVLGVPRGDPPNPVGTRGSGDHGVGASHRSARRLPLAADLRIDGGTIAVEGQDLVLKRRFEQFRDKPREVIAPPSRLTR